MLSLLESSNLSNTKSIEKNHLALMTKKGLTTKFQDGIHLNVIPYQLTYDYSSRT